MHIAVASRVSADRISRIGEIAAAAQVRVMENAQCLGPHLDWAEVVFGDIQPAQIALAPRLRWVQLTSAGFEPYMNLGQPGIAITTMRGVTAGCGAEHILGMMLAFTHAFPYFQAQQRARVWDRQAALPKTLAGQTLGILGLGSYGTALAVRAKALEMRVLAVKRCAGEVPPYIDALWTLEQLDELLAQADHVVINLPLTSATRGLMGPEQLRRMRPEAYLYNTSRGDIVDETALLDALRSGTIAGAGLDVFTAEPLPSDSPFWGLPNVVITPHVAGCWAGKWDAAFSFFCENLERYVAGQPLRNVANFERGY